jgi:hypothetical protein
MLQLTKDRRNDADNMADVLFLSYLESLVSHYATVAW